MADREKVIKGLEILRNGCAYIDCDDCCFYISTKPTRCGLREEQIQEDALAMLKDRTKDYEAWAKEIGADTCVNCRHASFNRNDGKSTCPIEHNFALVKDGFCHLFMRMEGR